ncbi:MAG: hypothetical protein L0956_06785 [Candidatus Mariimomonas ferrooxydans]
MSTFLWIIIIGAVFYMIMRKGGCCGGHSHGEDSKHSGHSHGNSNPGKTKDPVCGMEVEAKEKFDKDPTLYKETYQKQN